MSLFPNPFGYNVFILLHYSFAGFFTYLFLSRLELDRTASFWGGLVYMFSGFMTAHFVHYMIVTTAMYLPVLLYSLESFFVIHADSCIYFFQHSLLQAVYWQITLRYPCILVWSAFLTSFLGYFLQPGMTSICIDKLAKFYG